VRVKLMAMLAPFAPSKTSTLFPFTFEYVRSYKSQFVLILLFSLVAVPRLASAAGPQSPTPGYKDLTARYDYPSRLGLDFTEMGVEKRGKVLLIDLQYAGNDESDRVPAYLVLPDGDGPYPAILWGHWMMDGSPLRNRREFLDEALVLARSGVVSLLIDTPMVRYGYKAKSVKEDPLGWAEQYAEDEHQYIVDLRRGVDLLTSRYQVDRHRIAYVGHSFSAHSGAILAGIDKRICCFVLMAGEFNDEAMVRNATSGEMLKWKQALGPEKVNQYLKDYAWDDPANFISHTDDKSIFLQFASGDQVSRQQAQKSLDAFSAKDKKMEIYDASHALNASARLDRDRWLQQHLKFKHPDESALNAIPQLK